MNAVFGVPPNQRRAVAWKKSPRHIGRSQDFRLTARGPHK